MSFLGARGQGNYKYNICNSFHIWCCMSGSGPREGSARSPFPLVPSFPLFSPRGSGFILQLVLWSVPSSSQRGVQCTFLLQKLTFTRNKNKVVSCSCWWHLYTKRSLFTKSKVEKIKEMKVRDDHVLFTTSYKKHKNLTRGQPFLHSIRYSMNLAELLPTAYFVTAP